MKYFNLMNVSFSQLVIFQTAASTENFTQTAKQLHLTQPTVSKSISQLEKELGLTLFLRQPSQSAKLTPSGLALNEYCCNMIAQLSQVIINAQKNESDYITRLRVGANKDASNECHLLSIIKKFIDSQSDDFNNKFDLQVGLYDCKTLFKKLSKNELDAVLICTQEMIAFNDDSFLDIPLYNCPMLAYVPSTSSLYNHEQITLQDVATEPLILMYDSNANNNLSSNILTTLSSLGFTPIIGAYVDNMDSMIFNLSLGNGIIIADEFLRIPDCSNIKVFSLENINSSGLSIVVKKNDKSNVLLDFIAACHSYFETEYRCPLKIRK